MYIFLLYVVKMVITSPEMFHSLLFSDCNIAIRDTTIMQEINLWVKGPIFEGGASFFPPEEQRKKPDEAMSASKSAHAQEILTVV